MALRHLNSFSNTIKRNRSTKTSTAALINNNKINVFANKAVLVISVPLPLDICIYKWASP